ncbi:MAG: ABC transporter ATP-binding protein [Rhodobiaceae bacterium]|nr:ABC transporter ATP-binding protein [Rhodobiaceae bacterium]MCC0054860.1 ABC transporter ATP-binding protein [Rhodobiaceae bacterium]
MLQKILRSGTDIDRADDLLGHEQLSTGELVRMMVRDYLWPNRWLLTASFVSTLVVGASTGAIPLLLQFTADEIIVNRNRAMLTVVPVAIIIVLFAKALSEYVSAVTESYIGISITADLRKRVIGRLMHADLAWLQLSHSGRFVMTFMNDVKELTDGATISIISFVKNLLRCLFLVAAMFYLDWRLAIFAVAAIPIAIRLLGRHRGKSFKYSRQTMAETGDMGSLVSQALSGIRVVKAYDREDAESSRIGSTIERMAGYAMRLVRVRHASGPMTEALTGLGFAAAIMYGGWRGQQGTMTLGEFTGFIGAAMLIYQPLRQMATIQTTLQTGVAAAGRVFAVLNREHKVTDRPGASPINAEAGDIRFENVSFAYDDGKPVLRGIDFHVPAGRRFALVGSSGSGKSTIMNLLLRFYDPVEGRILLDGKDISEATLASVRQASALVTQDPFLFDDTIRANIAYGSEEASQGEIEAAARAAVAHDFIMELPNGYDTIAGEAGQRLSGGQKQRIAIARAMLRQAPILLLDEPTSALDSESEAQIQVALEHLIEGKTVIMIAHRLSTVRNADCILVLDKGRIVEQGTHEELIGHKGVYARLHKTQLAADAPVSERPTSRRRKSAKG